MTQTTERITVAMRDGTRLATDLYLPERPGRVPAILARTPYGRAANPVWFPAIGRLFAENGIAFVAQDTRGRYESEGERHPFVEAADGWDTCEWIVGQPWSDRTLAVFGESYVGFTAIAAAASGHPAIRAAALRNTTTDILGDWFRHQGVLRLEFVLRWALAAWSGPENLIPDFDWTLRPLDRIAAAALTGRPLPTVLDGWARGDGPSRAWPDDPGWPSLIDRVRVPVHLTTGWWDLFVRGAIDDWSRLAARPGVESLLVAQPTDHGGHDWGDGPTPDPLADFDALAQRLPALLGGEVAFMRRQLLGYEERSPAAVRWTLTNAGVRDATAWPPPDARPLTLHLVDGGAATRGPEGGGLSARADRLPVEVRWPHDPSRFVPALEGETIDGRFHRPDERATQVRDDVLTFTSTPMREPLDLAGPAVAHLLVRAPTEGGHVMAKLCDVDPAGVATRICDGACRVVPGGSGTRVSVRLGDTGYRVRPGHRLRLEVAAAAFPRYVGHPGTTDDPWSATSTRATVLGLVTGPEGSALSLTVLPGGS